MEKRAVFHSFWLPLALVTPQLIITFVFFVWPASQALYQSVLLEDPFGLKSQFVWFDNFKALFRNDEYIESFSRTAIFSVLVAGLAMAIALLLAVMADRVIKGATGYKTMLIWPYAVAPAVAGALWVFMFNPRIGIVAYVMHSIGYEWNHQIRGNDAFALITIAAVWKQISYNFVFFLAGLQAILSPTTFFLLVVNIVYAFFDTFGIVHATTNGGPAKATEILVYKVFNDGFIGLDLGSSAAQSVILMAIVVALTVVQFRYIERRVAY
jgi:sn-glycerol 3-phosphate transport system permease protein